MTDIEELIKKAKEFEKLEKFEQALDILEGLYEKNKHSDKINTALIDTLFSYGGLLNDDYNPEYEKAIMCFKRIIDIDKTNYRAFYNLGLAYFNLTQMNQALKMYKKALAIKPDYKYSYYNIGLIYEQKNNLKKALKYYEKALKIDKNFKYALHARNSIRKMLDEQKSNN